MSRQVLCFITFSGLSCFRTYELPVILASIPGCHRQLIWKLSTFWRKQRESFSRLPEVLYGTLSCVPTCQPRPDIVFLYENFFSFCSRESHDTTEGLHFVLQSAQAGPNLFWNVLYSWLHGVGLQKHFHSRFSTRIMQPVSAFFSSTITRI